MKKLIVAVCATAALAFPATAASASEIPPPAGTKPCPPPYTRGFILWVNTAPTGYHEEWFCIPGGPGVATTQAADPARAGVSKCTADGTLGVYAWYYDLQGGYHATRCIYTGP